MFVTRGQRGRPQTPAERQRKCRAIKRGEQVYAQEVRCDPRTGALLPPSSAGPTPALPAPPAPPALRPKPMVALPPARPTAALPAPASTSIEKATQPASSARAIGAFALSDADGLAQTSHLSLPPAVAARLKSLLDRHDAAKTLAPLTAAERAEAQGLIDIAEFFIVQRLRRRLAA